MTTPASTQLNHAACNIASPLILRRFKVFVPFQPCQFKSPRRFTSIQPHLRCQAQAATVTKKASGKPRTPGRPRSSGRPRKQTSDTDDKVADTGEPGKRVVIVGGGWAGFGAAKHLASQGYSVTLLDGSPNPGGLSAGWRTEQGRAVEAGVKGFWYQYHNIFALVRELGIPWPFTDWTTSGFWSPRGLTTEAPVFSRQQQYPTLLGQFVHTFPLFRSIPLADRLTMLPLLYSILDYDRSPASYEQYDKMSAWDLFQRYGVSRRLFEDFLRPLLLVGLFAPAEELSAAVMIGTLYFYALAHQNDFDVCWCKGSVSERIFLPLVDFIKKQGGKIVGGQLVTDVAIDATAGTAKGVYTSTKEGKKTFYAADAVIFAVGVTGMKKLISTCPALGAQPEFRAIMNLKGLDVISTRVWLDQSLPTRFPANVLAGFEPGVGGTYFNLTELQDEYKTEAGTVIAADFYHSNTLMPLSDEEIVSKVRANLVRCEPSFRTAKVVDSAVLRFPNAVTHFSPGSYTSRPLQRTSFGNVFMAGDWVKGLNHGANGLSQERAYITGLTAANLVIGGLSHGVPAVIIPVEEDEKHVSAAKEANQAVQGFLEALPLPFGRL
ncbi:hypothetical protein ABBQ38_010971 [Trebouxia sp. C0009 RCD-2024]